MINDTGYPVSSESRERVLQAVRELNYSPNRAAQQLKRTSQDILGLITRDISDSYFGEIARGVTERAMELGLLSFFCNTGRNPSNELDYHEILWQHRVRGIILSGGGFDTEEYRAILRRQLARMEEQGLRVVALAPQGMEVPRISVDYVRLAGQVVDYLVRHGHRRIALLSGPALVCTTQEHLRGYRQALSSHGIAYDARLVSCGEFAEGHGYESCLQLLDGGVELTAVFAGSDTIAVGVIHALRERGVRVPEEVSVTGIGDIPQARYTRPALTTWRIPRYQMGKQAVELIASAEELTPQTRFDVEPVLVERQSVSDRRKGDRRVHG